MKERAACFPPASPTEKVAGAEVSNSVLRSAPAPIVEQVGDVVVLGIHDDPRKWNTPAYQQTERAILEHIGPQYFFSREEPDRQLVAPDFGLSTSGA